MTETVVGRGAELVRGLGVNFVRGRVYLRRTSLASEVSVDFYDRVSGTVLDSGTNSTYGFRNTSTQLTRYKRIFRHRSHPLFDSDFIVGVDDKIVLGRAFPGFQMGAGTFS